jgi:hypothetical protein
MNTLNWYFLKFGYLFSKWWKIKDYKWSSLKKKIKKNKWFSEGGNMSSNFQEYDAKERWDLCLLTPTHWLFSPMLFCRLI